MRQLIKPFFIVLAILAWCAYSINPPEKKLKLGKDLRGGATLTYSVQIRPDEDATQTIDKTIEVLKRRVDPDGLLEISMNRQGRDRIEITMPLPSENVKKIRAVFEAQLADLGRNSLTEPRLDRLLRAGGEEREKDLKALGEGSPARAEKLRIAVAAYDDAIAKRTAYEKADDATKEAMINDVAASELKADNAKRDALATALTADEVRRTVQSGRRQRSIEDGGTRVKLPSPREVATNRLFAAHPESKDQIQKLLDAWNAYEKERTTLDDPDDLIRLLKGAGVLSFRITLKPGIHPDEDRLRRELLEGGPQSVKSTDARWFKINQPENWVKTKADAQLLETNPKAAAAVIAARGGYVVENYGSDFFLLAWDTRANRLTQAEGAWSVASASQTFDERGAPSVAFNMDATGAQLLGGLTRTHVNEQMAVLLDDEVYTAPNLQSAISSSGRITGDFSVEEVQYIVRVLSGGSLAAKLSPEPIAQNTVGPQLGRDNLDSGKKAGIIAIVAVAGFMLVYYFGAGAVAVVALACNALMIVGAMALSKASFTLPGIAGVILTFGMAVDSNVLIYERIREELRNGADFKSAVRVGFSRALASIVDGNLSNLIVCVVLYYTGTPEIKGFSITMGIGVICTLFSALVISRLIFDFCVHMNWRGVTKMLPSVFPAVQRAITPNVNWIGLRYAFFTISAIYVSVGLFMAATRGPKMLSNEFLGGTEVTMQFKTDASGSPVKLTRKQVEERVVGIAANVTQNDQLQAFRNADVLPLNPDQDGITSDKFTVKTLIQNADLVRDKVVTAFADVLDTKPKLAFAGSSKRDDATTAPAYAIDKPVLGANIDRPTVRTDVSKFVGGVAIVLDKLQPAPTLESLRLRLNTTRQTTAYSDTLSRASDIIVLDGDDQAVRTAVVLVRDELLTSLGGDTRWDSEVKRREWQLVCDALTVSSTPASVQNYSASVAGSFTADAITATVLSFFFIGVYIWVRFKNPRYAIAAVVALVHDVLTVVGLIALCEILYDYDSTRGIAHSLLLLPFKIDLNMVAALLTIAGYSLNDTVIIMDRIRENRGKLEHASQTIINDSVNQTFSRTLITAGTTVTSCLVLYFFGGEGMRPFAFALLMGMIVGTYSSVAVAAPIVWSRKGEKTDGPGRGGGLSTTS